MKRNWWILVVVVLVPLAAMAWKWPGAQTTKVVSRPEKVVSLRLVRYDQETYARLAGAWHDYYKVFPSEEAYANWMYAARYADLPDYEKLLKKGLKRYPANPTLLYLRGMLAEGRFGDEEEMHFLERAVTIDPGYADPWFSLVTAHMARLEEEQMDLALRKLLQLNAVPDAVLDYNYNVLQTLDQDALLVTNGDNDTYPVLILTRVLGIRPDVLVVNRSLLNTDWYLRWLALRGLEGFVDYAEARRIRRDTPPPWSDTLLVRLAANARETARPVYLAMTLALSPRLEELAREGEYCGLSIRITPRRQSRKQEFRGVVDSWLGRFRTGGLESWRVRYGNPAGEKSWTVANYTSALFRMSGETAEFYPEKSSDLLAWFEKYLAPLQEPERAEAFVRFWRETVKAKGSGSGKGESGGGK